MFFNSSTVISVLVICIQETFHHLHESIKDHFQMSRNSGVLDHLLFCNLRNGKIKQKEFKLLENILKRYI